MTEQTSPTNSNRRARARKIACARVTSRKNRGVTAIEFCFLLSIIGTLMIIGGQKLAPTVRDTFLQVATPLEEMSGKNGAVAGEQIHNEVWDGSE